LSPKSEQIIHNPAAPASTLPFGVRPTASIPGALCLNAGYGVDCMLGFQFVGTVTNCSAVVVLGIFVGNVALDTGTYMSVDFTVPSATTVAFSIGIRTPPGVPAGSISIALGFTSIAAATSTVAAWITPSITFPSDWEAGFAKPSRLNPAGLPVFRPYSVQRPLFLKSLPKLEDEKVDLPDGVERRTSDDVVLIAPPTQGVERFASELSVSSSLSSSAPPPVVMDGMLWDEIPGGKPGVVPIAYRRKPARKE